MSVSCADLRLSWTLVFVSALVVSMMPGLEGPVPLEEATETMRQILAWTPQTYTADIINQTPELAKWQQQAEEQLARQQSEQQQLQLQQETQQDQQQDQGVSSLLQRHAETNVAK